MKIVFDTTGKHQELSVERGLVFVSQRDLLEAVGVACTWRPKAVIFQHSATAKRIRQVAEDRVLAEPGPVSEMPSEIVLIVSEDLLRESGNEAQYVRFFLEACGREFRKVHEVNDGEGLSNRLFVLSGQAMRRRGPSDVKRKSPRSRKTNSATAPR